MKKQLSLTGQSNLFQKAFMSRVQRGHQRNKFFEKAAIQEHKLMLAIKNVCGFTKEGGPLWIPFSKRGRRKAASRKRCPEDLMHPEERQEKGTLTPAMPKTTT